MIKENSKKIQKYLFFVSSVFIVLILSHLSYKYIYNDAKTTPIKGGNISEGIIGTDININPLISINNDNKTIVNLVFRSLLKYNPENGSFEKDLATCDIKNLKDIECYIEEELKWSDGTFITINDIFKTYTRLKEVESSITIWPLLKDIKITTNDNKIIFSSESNDINNVKILLQPIVAADIIENMTERDVTGKVLNPLNMVYSGPYKVTDLNSDETTGIKTVVLNRNYEYNDDNFHIEKFSFKFFKDLSHLIKNKDRINIFNDTENVLGEYSPRIQSYKYKLPKITSLFINTEKIKDKNLRGFIMEKINRDEILKVLGENFNKAFNPLGTDTDTITSIKNKNLTSLIETFGYYNKSKIVDYLLSDEDIETTTSDSNTKLKDNPLLEIKISPFTNKYNFIEEDNILLKGEVDEKISAIYINDYKLTGFQEGNKYFYYRLKEESYETIKKGINSYKIYFEDNSGEKKLQDEIIVAYNTNENKLASYKKELLEVKEETKIYSNEVKIKELSSEQKAIKQQIDDLDDNFFYNRELEKFSLTIAYITGDLNIEKTANIIKNTLETFGLSIKLEPTSSNDLAKNLSAGINNYDLILVGLNLGYFNYDLFAYLHSSQAKNGYNLANFKKSDLDESLELLRESTLSEMDKQKEKDNIIQILQNEQILKSIYQPTEQLLVDKTIKNFKFWDYLPNYSERINYISGIYTLEKKAPMLNKKSFSGFFGFLIDKLF